MNDPTRRQTGPAERLRAVGLRVTAPRVATLDWLTGHPHATADQIADGVRARLGSVSTQAIYDVLHACTETGLLRRIEPAGHPARFETRTADNHHHLVCRSCGAIADVDCAGGEMPCLTAADDRGFVIDEAEVVYWGLCLECSTSSESGRIPRV